MTDLERKYIIPLRKEWLKVPRYKRSKKSIIAIREFCKKHMKSDDVKIGKNLNLLVWSRGMKNPPHKVEVDCLRKTNEKICHVELTGYDLVAKVKKEDKKEKVKKKSKEELEKKEETKQAIENIPETKYIPNQVNKSLKLKKEIQIKNKESEVIGRTGKK